jgi:hypothetical protein
LNQFWNLRPDERLREWKSFRRQLGQLTLEEACVKTAHFWSYAPYVNYYLDPAQKDNPWPDPWTLLHENYYCDIAKSLGMLYTLYLSDHRPVDIELCIYWDSKAVQAYNLVSVNKGKYILNFVFDEVVNKQHLDNSLELKHRYNAEDLKLDLY